MVPIVVDANRLRVAVAGEGEGALSRLAMLRAHGAEPVAVYAPRPCAPLKAAAAGTLVARWPEAADLAGTDVLFAAGLSAPHAEALAQAARAAKVLLNTEDRRAQCDFHVPAAVRQGDLLIAVSTGGHAPGLAKRIARYLGGLFGPEWAGRVEELCRHRQEWRRSGLDLPALARNTEFYIDQKGWLS